VVPHYKREKSIRGFCPHNGWGARQSLAKPWVHQKAQSGDSLATHKRCPATLWRHIGESVATPLFSLHG